MRQFGRAGLRDSEGCFHIGVSSPAVSVSNLYFVPSAQDAVCDSAVVTFLDFVIIFRLFLSSCPPFYISIMRCWVAYYCFICV